MDMEMQMTGETPANTNEPYSKNLVTIVCSFIALLTVRHVCKSVYKYIPFCPLVFTRIAIFYRRIENTIVNAFSLQFFSSVCPPIGGFLLILVMVSAILPLLLLNNNLAVNSNRAGFLVLALVPFLLSSTGKNSAVALLTGISSVKLNFLHRIIGMAVYILSTVHMACMIYSWAKFPKFLAAQLALTKVQYGLAGYGCLCVVILFSFLPIRIFSYELFLFTHLFGFGFIGVIALHTPYAMRYFFTGLTCYCLNLVAVWFVKTFIAQARIEVLPEGCTKMSIRLASPMPHSIGQHINLCIPAISPFEWHPFTITSVNHVKKENHTLLEIYVCSRGNFTRKLYNKVEVNNQDMRVFVSGPFGSNSTQADEILDNYSSVLIACGGAGITFGMRMVRELTQTLHLREEQDDAFISYAKKTSDIYFYWSVRRPLELEWFRQELEQLHRIFSMKDKFPRLHVRLYVTSTGLDNAIAVTDDYLKENVTTKEQDSDSSFSIKTATSPIQVVHGQRIDIKAALPVDDDVGAFVCGPASFNASFKNTVALHQTSTVELHCEDFCY